MLGQTSERASDAPDEKERDMAGTHWDKASQFLQSATQATGTEEYHSGKGGPQRRGQGQGQGQGPGCWGYSAYYALHRRCNYVVHAISHVYGLPSVTVWLKPIVLAWTSARAYRARAVGRDRMRHGERRRCRQLGGHSSIG